eukprot:5205243-Karenia_brevis.AAC.1
MVSGPDFFPDKRWRRISENAPVVTPQACLASFGRRVEAQLRTDWNALPILRSVIFQWEAEHTMGLATSFTGKSNEAMHTDVSGLIEAAQKLYKKPHTGFTGKGFHRIPIGGDMIKLPFAT